MADIPQDRGRESKRIVKYQKAKQSFRDAGWVGGKTASGGVAWTRSDSEIGKKAKKAGRVYSSSGSKGNSGANWFKKDAERRSVDKQTRNPRSKLAIPK